jgi:hypothetical protein
MKYRPHIVMDDPSQAPAARQVEIVDEGYLGVAFYAGPTDAVAGRSIRVTLMLIYWPQLEYKDVVPGRAFTLREGTRIVGNGTIVKRWKMPRELPK